MRNCILPLKPKPSPSDLFYAFFNSKSMKQTNQATASHVSSLARLHMAKPTHGLSYQQDSIPTNLKTRGGSHQNTEPKKCPSASRMHLLTFPPCAHKHAPAASLFLRICLSLSFLVYPLNDSWQEVDEKVLEWPRYPGTRYVRILKIV
jgi:hypothetical protein